MYKRNTMVLTLDYVGVGSARLLSRAEVDHLDRCAEACEL
jgi:hypothetical protein